MRRLAWLAGLAATASLLLPVPAQASTSVAMSNSRYQPAQVTIPAGETVVWTNNDSAGHTVTADDGSFDSNPSCGSLGGMCMMKGQNFSMTFKTPGSYPYYCRVHGGPGGRGMAGTVTVS
jgi:plastocyanin